MGCDKGLRFNAIWKAITRKKCLNSDTETTLLKRCLNLLDLSFLGIGVTIGAGIYLLVGVGIKEHAGPSIVISMLCAGLTACLSGLCVAEFAATVNRAGSLYIYMYTVIGELGGFIVGWNTLLIYTSGAAADARAFSKFIDSLVGNVISNRTIETLGIIKVPGLNNYPDFLALGIVFTVVAIAAVGVKTSLTFNNFVSTIAVGTLISIILINFSVCDGINVWKKESFFPHGLQGTFQAASMMFFLFLGQDCVALASEEAQEPTKSVPRAILITSVTVTTLYTLCTTSVTLLVPTNEIDTNSPYTAALQASGIDWARYVIAVGTMAAVCTTVLGIILSLSRLPYAMACDGLFFSAFTYITPTSKVPLVSLLSLGGFTSFLTFIVDIEILMFEMSAAVLLNYFLIASCVIYLRYIPNISMEEEAGVGLPKLNYNQKGKLCGKEELNNPIFIEGQNQKKFDPKKTNSKIGALKDNFNFLSFLNGLPGGVAVKCCLCCYIISCFLLFIIIIYVPPNTWWAILLLVSFFILAVMSVIIISLHHQRNPNSFKVPLVPFLPCLSLFCIVGLMVNITPGSWLQLSIWMVIGSVIYFAYGMKHSKEREPTKLEQGQLVISQDEAVHIQTATVRAQAEQDFY